jgi:hypothetical protein
VNQSDSPFTNQQSPVSIRGESMASLFRTWLQLFRAPNLFTVPGDPLAGYLLAAYGAVEPTLFLPLAASLCFYAGGLLLNDLVDLREDLAERPQRPLPSGAASRVTVGMFMAFLFLGALALCLLAGASSLGVGGVLLGAILTYNLRGKEQPVFGAFTMGLCRGLSILLGATAVPHGELSIPLMMHGRLNHLVLGWITFFPMVGGPNRAPTFALFLLAFVLSVQVGWELSRQPQAPLPAAIGKLIRLLLILQAAFCAATGPGLGSLSAALLILCWPLSRAISQRFYAS